MIPTLNERTRLPGTLAAVCGHLSARAYPWEVLVVDDGSTDGTVETVRAAAAAEPRIGLKQLIHNLGKGATVKEGLRVSAGRYVFFIDADLATPISHLDDGLSLLVGGADMVYADRYRPGARLTGYTPLRRLMSRSFNLLARTLVGTRASDTQCGFKGFRRDVIPIVLDDSREDGFAFDLELFLIARERGLRVAGFPVCWSHHAKGSKIRPLEDSLHMTWRLLALRRRYRHRERPGSRADESSR